MNKINIFSKTFEVLKKNDRAILAGSLAGLMILTTGCKNKDVESTVDPTPTTTISQTVEPTPTVSQPVEVQKPIVLTANNFNQEAAKIIVSDTAKGLSVATDKVKSTLFIANIDNLSAEDIYAIFGYKLDGIEDENTRLKLIAEEIQNMYDYVSAVRTHNNNGNEYVSMTQLIYNNNIDKLMIEELDAEYLKLMDNLKEGKITSEEFQKSFKYVTEFYTGAGYLNVVSRKYNNYSLTAGAGLLSEAYWPMFAVTYSSSELLTKENKTDIKTLSEGTNKQPAVVNGSKYLGSIINMVDSCTNSLEEDKTLTK